MRILTAIALALTACAGAAEPAPPPDPPECDTACACDLIEHAPVMTGELFRKWAELRCGSLDSGGAK